MSENKHFEAENLILFFFIGITWGAILTYILSKYSILPYTVTVFFSGIAISAIVGHLPEDEHDAFTLSARKWQEIDPHLMLYLFLPILIYGDSISLNWTQVKSALVQTMILAGPGVLIGAFLMGLFIYYCTNLGWSWYLSMLFGSILSGTDPVAVVALLKDVNTSPRLFLLIIGESILNDGTCIVMYTLYLDLVAGKSFTVSDIITFFVKMLCGSPLLGICIGFISIFCLQTACRSLSTVDRTIQIIITLSCAYLAFYFSEKSLHLSGILACGAAGLMISKQGLTYLVDLETIHLIWELFEWFGNTMIFFLAGVIYGGKAIHYSITGADFGLLIIIYIFLMVLRVFVLIVLYPFISKIGLKCSIREAIFMSWSGLRGALGMALGLAVWGEREHLHLDQETADKFFFFIGGICTLTLLINALTAPKLLSVLGLIVDTTSSVEYLTLQKKVNSQLKQMLENEMVSLSPQINTENSHHDNNIHNISPHNGSPHSVSPHYKQHTVSIHFPIDIQEVKKHITLFSESNSTNTTNSTANRSSRPQKVKKQNTLTEPRLSVGGYLVTSDRRLIYCRHMFLTCLRAQYWKSINDGKIPRSDKVAQCLLYSVEHSIHNTSEPLSDWSIVNLELASPLWWDTLDKYFFQITPTWFPMHYFSLTESAKHTYDRIYILINFISAHEISQHEIFEFLDDENPQLYNKRLKTSQSVESDLYNSLNKKLETDENNIWFERSSAKVFNEIHVVIEESKENVKNALKYLQSLDSHLVSSIISIIQARALLSSQAERVEHMVEEGFLTSQVAEEYLSTIRNDINKLDKVKHDINREDIRLKIEASKSTNQLIPSSELYSHLKAPNRIVSLDAVSVHNNTISFSTEMV